MLLIIKPDGLKKQIMSRTIETRSGSEFFTNINSEQLLGELCKELGCKYDLSWISEIPKLAFYMNSMEVQEAANKIRETLESPEIWIKKYSHYFEKGAGAEDWIESMEYYIECFEKSEGYECI